MFRDARDAFTQIAPALAIALASVTAQASGFPVSLDDYLPQTAPALHVYMQPDGSALVMSGDSTQLSLHRLDRDPLTPSFSNRFVGGIPNRFLSFEQEEGSFWAHYPIPTIAFPSPQPENMWVSYWRFDPTGRLLHSGGASARFGSSVFELNTGFYAISHSVITDLARAVRTRYAPCTNVLGAEIDGCSPVSIAAAREGFWAVRRLLEAPGLYRFEALRFSVQGQLQETQSIPGSYNATFAQFWRHADVLRFVVHGNEQSVFNISDLAGWQIVQAGTVQTQGTITPVGAGDWLLSTPTEIMQYTPVQFSGTLVPLSARYRSACEDCVSVRSNAQGEVLVGRKSDDGYFKWLTRDGLQKLEQHGVYDAYFARDGSVLVLAPDDAANPRGTRARWFNHNAQALVTEDFSPALITPQKTQLFEGKNAQVLAVADSRQSPELPIYRIDSAGVRVRVGTGLPSRSSLPDNDSQPGSGHVHRKLYIDSIWHDVVYESTDSESGEQFRVLIQDECAGQASPRFTAVGAGLFDFRQCRNGPLQIRHIQAGQVRLVVETFDSLTHARTNPVLASGDELRVLTRAQDQPYVQVHGLSAAGMVLRYQHQAANNATLTLLADGSLLVAEIVDGVLKVRRVWENSVHSDYPICGSSGGADAAGNVWSVDTSARKICHTTPLGVLSQINGLFAFGLVSSNGDLIARNQSGRCVRLHPQSGQLHALAFGADGLCSLYDQIVVGEHLYRVERRTLAPGSTDQAATVLVRQALPSVAEVMDVVFSDGFE